MATDEWQRIDQLFHAALERPAASRAAFLDEACAGDEALRRELESLLGAHEETDGFFEAPPADLAADWLSGRSASLVGGRLSHYQILSVLGKGGMGEVYLARDERLERQVALKLLPARFTADGKRVRRFIREAKAASALNHPNIITIHEIGQTSTETGEAGGLHFIVTEYIAGETLREHMRHAGLPLARALDVAIQVASALSTAHEAGIIHRDIKPENLMLRRDGYVKVLDFGLAKLAEKHPAATITIDTERNTLSGTTAAGTVVGTAHYMSPEQARGQEVDARTDIFSLGVALYEMLAGRTPFDGMNAIEVMGAILNQEPPPLTDHFKELPPELARELEMIVAKALRKDREQRYQTINDLLLDLKNLIHLLEFTDSLERPPQSTRPKAFTTHPQAAATDETQAVRTTSSTQIILGEVKRHKLGVALTLVIAAVIAVLAYRALNRRVADAPVTPFVPVPFSSLPGLEDHAAFSPDGNQLAFSWNGGVGGNTDIYVKLVGVGAPLQLTRDPAEDIFPVWSPDGRYIAFIRMGATQSEVVIVPVLGGPERRLCATITARSRMAWSPDGKWLAMCNQPGESPPGALVLVSVETGKKQTLTKPPPNFDDSSPAFSPDGRQLIFVRTNNRTFDELYLVSASGGEERRLTTGSKRIRGADWTADGREIIYCSSRVGKPSLWQLPVAGGEPAALPGTGWDAHWPAVSRRGGRLAFTESYEDTNILRLELLPLSYKGSGQGSGAPSPLIVSKRAEHSPQVSPDGKKIAFVSDRSGHTEIWVCDHDGGNPLQLTQMGNAEAGSMRWSPDGQRLVFGAHPEQSEDLFVVNASGGAPQRLTIEPAQDMLPSWSRDGQWIYFCSNRAGDYQIWKMPVAGGSAVQVTRHGGFETFESSDGQTVYYSKWSGVDGLWSVPAAGGAEQPVPELAEAGYWRAWAVTKDGIYYVAHTSSTPPHPVKFFNFATRQTMQLGVVEKTPPWHVPSLSVAPDGQWLFYAQSDRLVSTLMLVENFR